MRAGRVLFQPLSALQPLAEFILPKPSLPAYFYRRDFFAFRPETNSSCGYSQPFRDRGGS